MGKANVNAVRIYDGGGVLQEERKGVKNVFSTHTLF